MAERSRRSITQPCSYKEFSEWDHSAIPENSIQDPESLLMGNLSDESREGSGCNSPFEQDESQMGDISRSMLENSAGDSEVLIQNIHHREGETGSGMDTVRGPVQVDLYVNPEEDDLDKDTGNKRT